MSPPYNYGSHGQALLITVVIMVVVLTVGLAVASRSIIQVKTAADEASSEKAFAAAEAGIDQVLKTGTGVSNQDLKNNSTIASVSIAPTQNIKQIEINNGGEVYQDQGADVWLSGQDYAKPYTGTLQIYWGQASSPDKDAALQISIIVKDNANPIPYSIKRYAYDPFNGRINSSDGNNFTLATNFNGGSPWNNGENFNYVTDPIPVTSALLMRIIPLYTNTIVGVSGSADIPAQGQFITSTGVSGTTQRKITYFQGYNSVPSELFYSLFSPQ